MSSKRTIPDDILAAAGLTERECRIELAVHLSPSAAALPLSGLTRNEFERELTRRDISLYSVEDLRQDVSDLERLGRQ